MQALSEIPTASILNEQSVLHALTQVIDPEIGVNIVDLGLIYRVIIDGAKVVIEMSLTTQGCPMHESIAFGVQNVLLALPGVEEVDVELVWDPPWTPDRIAPGARELLGIE